MKNFETIRKMAVCLLSTKRIAELSQLIERYRNNGLDESASDMLLYYEALGKAVSGSYEDAISRLKELLKKKPNFLKAQQLIFKLLLSRADQCLAEKNYSQLSDIVAYLIKNSPAVKDGADILSKYKAALPLSYIKSGHRAETEKLWIEDFLNNPGDLKMMHKLAVLYYWWAVKAEELYSELINSRTANSGKNNTAIISDLNVLLNLGAAGSHSPDDNMYREQLDRVWIKAIGYWSAVLNNSTFWDEFKAEKERAWNTTLSGFDKKELKKKVLDTKIGPLLNDKISLYKQTNDVKNYTRLESYEAFSIMERRIADNWPHVSELALKSINKGKSKGDDKILRLFTGTVSPGFIVFEELNQLRSVYSFVVNLHQQNPDDDKCALIRVCLSPDRAGKYYMMVTEKKLYDPVIDTLAGLPGGAATPEMLCALASAYFEKGNVIFASDTKFGLKLWTDARKILADQLINNDAAMRNFASKIKQRFGKLISESCVKEAKKFNQASKFDDAISIAKKGLELVEDKKELNEQLAGLYVEEGHRHLKEKRFGKARSAFEAARTCIPGYKPALEGLGITYNNEGLTKSGKEKIALLEKAYELEPTDNVVMENLAGAYNSEAVSILNSMTTYSYDRSSNMTKVNNAIELLMKAINILNPKLDRATINSLGNVPEWSFDQQIKDFSDEQYKVVLKNMWMAQQFLKQLRGY